MARKASFKEVGGKVMFSDQQDDDDKIDKTPEDEREEPKTPPKDENEKSDEADYKNIDMEADEQSNGSELISEEVDEE